MSFQALPADGKHRAGHSWNLELAAGLRSRQVRVQGARIVPGDKFAGRHVDQQRLASA